MRASRAVDTLFPEQKRVIQRMRATDASFSELCDHLDLLHKELTQRFGSIDAAASDLISSFDDVRREIERHLTRVSTHKTTSDGQYDDNSDH